MRFEDLVSWQSARALARAVYALTRSPEVRRDFGLCGQRQRAAVSIMSTLAEGFERQHLQEKIQFYTIARGSNAEVRSLLYVIEDNYAALGEEAAGIRDRSAQCGRLVTGLIRSTQARKEA